MDGGLITRQRGMAIGHRSGHACIRQIYLGLTFGQMRQFTPPPPPARSAFLIIGPFQLVQTISRDLIDAS